MSIGLSCLCSTLQFLISCLISCQTRLVSTVSSPLPVPRPRFSSLLLHQFPLSVGGDLTSPLKDWLIFTYIEFHCDMLSIYFKHQCIAFIFLLPNKTKLPCVSWSLLSHNSSFAYPHHHCTVISSLSLSQCCWSPCSPKRVGRSSWYLLATSKLRHMERITDGFWDVSCDRCFWLWLSRMRRKRWRGSQRDIF